jgi:mycothiol system anti-sigma-R factor
MSCGDPHETPCSEVLEAVYLYLDGEQDAQHHDKIRIHLDECAPCLRQYGLEQAVKSLVARCCGSDAAPSTCATGCWCASSRSGLEIEHVEYRAE